MAPRSLRILPSALRRFIESETAGGLVLMASAALALLVANSPLRSGYAALTRTEVAGLTLTEWINDGLMAVFFLLVGLEIKREVLHGRLRTWPSRALPGLAALGGMVVPALVFLSLNHGQSTARGWAVPGATDIAFALGVLSLLGTAVPASLKVFLTALAVLDDLGAVLIIALFYTTQLSLPMLGAATGAMAALLALNAWGVRRLTPYLLLGVALWVFLLRSGIHPTIGGVLLAATVPAEARASGAMDRHSPLHRLEGTLGPWAAFVILPVFGFANAGVPIAAGGWATLLAPTTVGTALGLALGKQVGVFGAVWLAVRLGVARRPSGASWLHVYGVALLCGIGFTMSLFIGLLAFRTMADWQNEVKIGVLAGSVLSAMAGAIVLRFAHRIDKISPAE